MSTQLLNNRVFATGAAVDISNASLIGPQEHAGNEWYPVIIDLGTLSVIFRAAFHARCDGCNIQEATANQFSIHTEQSIFNEAMVTYDFFSEFHPENVDPDMDDEFLRFDQGGSPSSGFQAVVLPS